MERRLAVPAMSLPSPTPLSHPEPAWFRWASRLVMRLGPLRATLLMTAVVTVLAALLAQLVITAVGRGDRIIAAVSATFCSLVLTPVIGSFVLRLVFELERTRQQLTVPWQSATVSTTVSIGVAPLRGELPSLDWMIHEADTALYAAKADGRNCVRTLPFEPSRSGGTYSVNSR